MVLLLWLGSFSILSGQTSPREHLNFDENWLFHFGHAENPEQDFNYSLNTIFSKSGNGYGTAIAPEFADTLWRKLDLPHDWAVELPFANHPSPDIMSHGYKPVGGQFPETSIGWYRKHFFIPVSDFGRRLQVQFDGVFRDAEFWLNGFYLGNNESGYIGETYDITDVVRYGGENVLVVRVDATQKEGWFYEGAGIYRHVWLNKYQPAHIAHDGIFVYANVSEKKATVSVETTLENEGMAATELDLEATFTTRDGKELAKATIQKIKLAAAEKATVKSIFNIENPHLWNLDDPYLYRVQVSLKNGNKLLDQQSLRYGLRDVQIKADGVFLNGEHLKLQGVNCHQDHAGVGSALPDYMQYYRISLLKNMGVNAYRTSHNPPTPELLDACDSLGMLVMDENRLLNSNSEHMGQFVRLLKRDRSHPSVFMWSIGNEEFGIQQTDFGKHIAQTLVRKQQQIDPTRTCTYASDLPNVFKGINEVIPVRGFNYREFAVEDYHRDHPNQPIIGTEMGSTVTTRGVLDTNILRGYLPDQDISAPWWASTAEAWWPLAAENDFWLGGFVWTGFDYRGEPTPFSWPNVNSHFGILDMCGFPKNIYYYYQSWWTDKDVLHISPHWNHQDRWGDTIDVWVNTNAEAVELFLNGQSLGKKEMARNSHLKWPVAFRPGKLRAVATKQGRTFYKEIETTGPPTEVVLTPYKTTLLADGQDVSVINVSVVDSEGREVPNASNKISFHLEGNAKIIGVGNGDPSCHEPDKGVNGAWERSLFNGKCQVLVQAGKAEDIIHFEATSPNLWKGSTDIITVSPASLASVTIDPAYQLKGEAAKPRPVDKMIGADISFLPQLEDRGFTFKDEGTEKDAIEILNDHGFNYVRLRIFNNPAREGGYSPEKGFCDLENTKAMAKRVKAAGMKLLLDFHYSDYWADPGKQYKPKAWEGLGFQELKKALYDYTYDVIKQLQDQGTTPDMVQIGNEINHGIVWPEGSVGNLDSLAQLLNAGAAAVKAVDPTITMMLHVALGGQNHESVFFIDNMIKRGVHFDVIGESYYPKWHGTLDDLRDNLTDLIRRYDKDVIVVEYSAKKDDVHQIVFDLPGGHGKGTCIWEPLNTWEKVFDTEGNSNELLKKYDGYKKRYLE